MDVRKLQMHDFTYNLPEERIAKYPLPERDSSKLLVYKNQHITSSIYRDLATYLPSNSLLVFNNTRVIPARLFFENSQGALIEIFCLEPAETSAEISSGMEQTSNVRWNCLVGRASKWKEKILKLEKNGVGLSAQIVARSNDAFVIEFSWNPAHLTFAEVLEQSGTIPIPPYLHRNSDEQDKSRYQTVYAALKGSVAAPTAGLHFTPQIFESLQAKNIQTVQLTLHVGAGTFKPVKSDTIGGHQMHLEWMDVSIGVIQQLLKTKQTREAPLIAVGTTSMRTLESLYWMSVKTSRTPDISPADLNITQWEPYESDISMSAHEALQSLLQWMQKNKLERLTAKTGILIAPGYQFKMVDALITNFHQPGSTLLLLVAALVGSKWKEIYNYALNNDFRFLSYGDGCLLWTEHAKF